MYFTVLVRERATRALERGRTTDGGGARTVSRKPRTHEFDALKAALIHEQLHGMRR